jgi:hypothetical protein
VFPCSNDARVSELGGRKGRFGTRLRRRALFLDPRAYRRLVQQSEKLLHLGGRCMLHGLPLRAKRPCGEADNKRSGQSENSLSSSGQ